MNLGKINLITPPDSLFNHNVSYLLIKPNTKLKMQFQALLSSIPEDVNVFIYDTDEADITWMLNSASNADVIIIDIDNCDLITKNFISLLMAQPNVYYMTNDEITPWNLISRNRIFNLDWVLNSLSKEDGEDEEDERE